MTDGEMEDIVEESCQLEERDGKDLLHVQDEYMDNVSDENRISLDRVVVNYSANDRILPLLSNNDDIQSHKQQRESFVAGEDM